LLRLHSDSPSLIVHSDQCSATQGHGSTKRLR
jgi:hypothetical protein